MQKKNALMKKIIKQFLIVKNVYGDQTAKNIYLGETRIVTKLNSGDNPTYQEEYYKQYFYHSDQIEIFLEKL